MSRIEVKRETKLEIVEIISISELPGEGYFAEVKTALGKVRWEKISPEEACREKKRLDKYRVIKKRPRRDVIAPAVKPVIRIESDGRIGFGSNLAYKGIGADGRPEYWHIPTATIMVEDVSYATRQMAATLLILRKGLI